MSKKTATCLVLAVVIVAHLGLFMCIGCKPKTATTAPPVVDPLRPKSLQLPEVQAALETKKEVDRCRTTLCSFNQKLDHTITQTVESMPPLGLDTTDASLLSAPAAIDRLIESTRKLRVMGRDILAQKNEYLAAFQAFEKPVLRAPAELRRAAELFKQFGEEEEYEAFRADYVVMSQMFLALANRYDSQREQFAQEFNKEDYLKTMAYLERGVLMLDRFETALEVARSSSQLPEAQYYMQKLRAFVQAFEDFRTQIRQVNKLLDESKSNKPEGNSTPSRKEDQQASSPLVHKTPTTLPATSRPPQNPWTFSGC